MLILRSISRTENALYLARKADELRIAQAKLDEEKRIAEAA
jgi:hypothetical protein